MYGKWSIMRIFLGAPFTNYLNDKGFNKELKKTIKSIMNSLEKKGHIVRSAHVREGFGSKLMLPEVCTPLDFEEVKKCELFIAIPSNPPSGGVHIELGWASAIKKDIILCIKKNGKYSPLVQGISKISNVRTVLFNDYSELTDKIISLLE